MQGDFIRTQLTLIKRLARDTESAHEADWARFFDIYYAPMIKFAEMHGGGNSAEDVVQEVLVKVVEAFRTGKYAYMPGVSFRAYLLTLLHHELVNLYWREQSRGAGRKVPIEESSASVPEEAGARIDVEWRLARHQAAVEHVMNLTAIAERTKAAYRAYVIEGRPVADVAAELGLSRNDLSQIKVRMSRRIAAVESMYEEKGS